MQKVSVHNTPTDEKTHPDISGARVQSLINSGTVGSHRGMLSIAEFEPGGEHKLHRHPNCEQATFLLSESGLHLTDRGELAQEVGDAIYVSKGEWHGFRNTGTEFARLVPLHGAGSLAEAGYESFAGRPGVQGIPPVAVVRLRDLQGD